MARLRQAAALSNEANLKQGVRGWVFCIAAHARDCHGSAGPQPCLLLQQDGGMVALADLAGTSRHVDLAALNPNGPVAESLGAGQVMTDKEHGCTCFRGQTAHPFGAL